MQEKPQLWNPNAAANWCLLFTPAFGSYLHMLNWQAMGREDKAKTQRMWFCVSLVLLLVYLGVGIVYRDSDQGSGLTRLTGFAFLIAWYVSSARDQARYVADTYGKDYAKKPWGGALLTALGGVVVYIVIAFIIGIAIGMASVASTGGM